MKKKSLKVTGYLSDVQVGDMLWYIFEGDKPQTSAVKSIEYDTRTDGNLRVSYINVRYFYGEEEDRDGLCLYVTSCFKTRKECLDHYIAKIKNDIEHDKCHLKEDEARLEKFIGYTKEKDA